MMSQQICVSTHLFYLLSVPARHGPRFYLSTPHKRRPDDPFPRWLCEARFRFCAAQRKPTLTEVLSRRHQVVILPNDLSVLIPPVESKFVEPLDTAFENLSLPVASRVQTS